MSEDQLKSLQANLTASIRKKYYLIPKGWKAYVAAFVAIVSALSTLIGVKIESAKEARRIFSDEIAKFNVDETLERIRKAGDQLKGSPAELLATLGEHGDRIVVANLRVDLDELKADSRYGFSATRTVEFKPPFAEPPMVFAALSFVDSTSRAEVTVAKVTKDGAEVFFTSSTKSCRIDAALLVMPIRGQVEITGDGTGDQSSIRKGTVGVSQQAKPRR